MKQFRIILLCLVILGCNDSKKSKEKEIFNADTFSELTSIIDQYADETLQKGNINSIALAIYKDGKVYKNYYGEIDKGLKNKPNDSSHYEIASITKTFTGALVAKAALDGKLSLEDDIRDYLKGDYSNLEFRGEPITIKNLLTHSIGFNEEASNGLHTISNKINKGAFKIETETCTIQDFLEELKTVEINKKPGTVYAYNSVGPELLAYILEQVNEATFNEQLEVFLKDLGMKNTYMQTRGNKSELLVNSYKNEKLANLNVSPLYGAAGGAISTLPDLTRYMQYLIEHKNDAWVKEASRELFVDEEEDENVGYLWQNMGFGEEEGYYYSKTGTSNGVQSGVLICPDSDYGIVVVVNNVSDDAFSDWATLFFAEIETDLINYPKLNLTSKLKNAFSNNSEQTFKEFRNLKDDTTNYFVNLRSLNNYGYQLLNDNQEQKAIDFFTVLTKEFPENANIYDSLGEAYFIVEDYDNAIKNYKKSLGLDSENENAKIYINKLEQLILNK